ncbi:MAG: DUF262 domain-containing protein [Acidobacteriia bacterium]|nr:DUF262 domain-containing protein [Terriglobia bacterium]
MKTTATNRKVRELLTRLREGKLIPDPAFQRRLVWSNKDNKSAFLETVLLNYPFPEVYVAAGEVNVETGEGTELLVDGQQRLTTLLQYFTGSPDLILYGGIKPYTELAREQKEAFLQYDVVVRDLGLVELDVLRNVFQRINATRYALNAMEIHNSRFEGEFKAFGEQFAQRPFFENHRVFSASEIRRMQDVRFGLTLGATALSTYFNRDDELEEYLSRYNDDFPMRSDLERELDTVLEFIDQMNVPATSRIWKKADLLTAIVELHGAAFKRQKTLEPTRIAPALLAFYATVDDPEIRGAPESDASRYYKAALQASNDRSSRATRGEIIRKLIETAG